VNKLKKIAGTTDNAVLAKTGKDWSWWFAILDKEKSSKLTHKEIALLLHDKYKVTLWWAQKITVGYEQERGLRKLHQKSDGFQISKSKSL